MDARGGRTGRGDVLRWCEDRELDEELGRSGCSSWFELFPDSPDEELSCCGDEFLTFDGVLNDSSNGFGSR